jgi:hypothetical protein
VAWCKRERQDRREDVFHHDLVDLRVFFEDIVEWGWSSAPQRRLLFLSERTCPDYPNPCPEP